ncbi:hypothetical protein THASP1DRAFT_30632 [Thamnocephalis sphaerospora]|uniref:Major facilitator superfamily domain-containing protein n=1 Tax=Thamnocephalis sphaerospora TaxID=78915 RepID=A0A4P9XNK4_9FUNG|nr:hypothetical protein THASP1DRAFT_30632 [Thamnocephalis sphaerospora]|eukprot:RKP07544.1 hypothetical protein THASP1DRAFT_30632 [Thamnocephalis sphaerospora]
MASYAPIYLLFPWLSKLAGSVETATMLWFGLTFFMGIRVACGVLAFTSYNLLVINSARDSGALGTVNGVAMCVQSLARSFGPALGGVLWSWPLNAGLNYPFNYTLAWNVIALVSLVTAFLMRPSFSATDQDQTDDLRQVTPHLSAKGSYNHDASTVTSLYESPIRDDDGDDKSAHPATQP